MRGIRHYPCSLMSLTVCSRILSLCSLTLSFSLLIVIVFSPLLTLPLSVPTLRSNIQLEPRHVSSNSHSKAQRYPSSSSSSAPSSPVTSYKLQLSKDSGHSVLDATTFSSLRTKLRSLPNPPTDPDLRGLWFSGQCMYVLFVLFFVWRYFAGLFEYGGALIDMLQALLVTR